MSFSPVTEAIMFFDPDGQVGKEMLFQEFEAILDGVVYLPEFSDQLLYCAYVQINSYLQVRAVLGFQVDFDDKGRVDRDWNIPLDHLVSQVSATSEISGQSIKVVGKSNCPVSWHADSLWDIKAAHVKKIIEAAQRNLLGVLVDELPEEEETAEATGSMSLSAVDVAAIRQQLQGRFQQLYQERSRQLLEQQRAHLQDLKNNYKERLQTLALRHQDELAEYKAELRKQEDELHQQIRLSQSLQEQLKIQAERFALNQAEMNQQLKDLISEGQGGAPTEREAQDVQRLVDEATQRLQQQLEIKEMELNYRNELDFEMQAEVHALESEVAALRAAEPDPNVRVRQLHEKGVVLVAFQPGAGHITLPQRDIDVYLEDPVAYAAQYCRVDRALYEAWLQHYHSPSCEHRSQNNIPCGQPVDRVGKPAQFVPGQSNRCRLHKEKIH